MLNKKQILECSDIETEIVQVPEWGGEVMVYGLTNGEKDEFENSLVSKDSETGERTVNMKYASARLCSMCVRDEDGNNIFAPSDVVALSKKSGKAVERIYDVAERLSGLGTGAVEEMVKNSEKTPTGGSD
jgi:hypothetical protein